MKYGLVDLPASSKKDCKGMRGIYELVRNIDYNTLFGIHRRYQTGGDQGSSS